MPVIDLTEEEDEIPVVQAPRRTGARRPVIGTSAFDNLFAGRSPLSNINGQAARPSTEAGKRFSHSCILTCDICDFAPSVTTVLYVFSQLYTSVPSSCAAVKLNRAWRSCRQSWYLPHRNKLSFRTIPCISLNF